MQILLSLFTNYPYIDWPYDLLGWVGWILLFLALIGGLRQAWEPLNLNRFRWAWLLLLGALLLTPITSQFIGIQLPLQYAAPVPDLPVESNPVIMIFMALPWVLVGGILGPFPAVLVGAAGGLFTAFWQTHNFFTILEMTGLALAFSISVRQRYRTLFFRVLRSPLAAAILLAILYSPVYFLTAFLMTRGSLVSRVDYSLSQTWMLVFSRGFELVFAGMVGEVLSRSRFRYWGRNTPLEPSPSEKSLQTRFLFSTLPMVIALFLSLVVSDWIVAGTAATRLIRNRLSSTALVASESLPYFLETGQNLIQNLANEQLLNQPAWNVDETLALQINAVPYFRQLFLFDANGRPVTGYPVKNFDQIYPSPEEAAGIKLALHGVLIQTYVIKPWPGENTAQVSFLATIRDANEKPIGVLLGRTDLNSNPFTQPAIQALQSVKEAGGEGIILDENQRILYHSRYNVVMDPYTGKIPQTEDFFSDTSSNGSRKLVYYRQVEGRPWAVMLSVPAEVAQQTALDIAVPLLAVLLAISIALYLVLRYSLRQVAFSLKSLAKEAKIISDGSLDHPMVAAGVDEVGQFASAFEQMRKSLKARIDELKQLLAVSEGVASNLEAGDALRPVLDAAIVGAITSARVVLVRDILLDPESNVPVSFGSGPSTDRYAYLDSQILELMRSQQDMQVIPNTARMRRLTFPPRCAVPGALIMWPLSHDYSYYGTLWVGLDTPHVFKEEELRYLSTLAGQAALAATNARLYASAEVGRQRLEAVLASTPEPVLVVDAQMQLLLLNPAALQVPGLVNLATPGRPIKDVVGIPALLDLVLAPVDAGLISREINMPNGRIYYASASPVIVDGTTVGKIAMLRDISHYKQLDQLKSEFVSTVSHDLRSPLTLMRGYATMLPMVGDLNEQQKSYVLKITAGVENMSRLVNNLLDLGRIDAGIGLKIERVSSRQVVDRVVTLLTPQANQKSIQLTVSATNGLAGDLDGNNEVIIEADAALLEQALYNLVENAIKYTPVSGQIYIGCEQRSDGVQYEVRDTGIGIAPLDLPHVFEKFYRSGRREAYQQRGTGLGLAIVKSIVERHHGRIWVDSYLGKGSSFWMLVPLKQEEAIEA
jgi:signal transduction histidine kinase/HAMP domain-containing protein